MNKLKRLLAGSALALGLVLPLASPAEAANWNLSTNGDFSGYAEAGGSVTWPGKYSVKISGYIDDVCDSRGGDGKGAYLTALPFAPDGDPLGGYDVAADTRGCTYPAKQFGPVGHSESRRIHYILLTLCEWDQGGSTGPGPCTTKRFNNPNF